MAHRPGQSPEPEFKHPAHEVFRAEDLYAKPEWQTPAEACLSDATGFRSDATPLGTRFAGRSKTGASRSKISTDQPLGSKNSRPDRRTFPNGYEGVQHRNLLRGDSSPSQPHREAPQDTPKHLPRPDPNPNSDIF